MEKAFYSFFHLFLVPQQLDLPIPAGLCTLHTVLHCILHTTHFYGFCCENRARIWMLLGMPHPPRGIKLIAYRSPIRITAQYFDILDPNPDPA